MKIVAKLNFCEFVFCVIYCSNKKRPEGRILFFHDFAFGAVEFAQGSIELIFWLVDYEIVSAAVFYHVAAKAELILSEMIPWMFFVSGICSAPEVEVLLTIVLSIHDHLCQNCDTWLQFAEFVIGCGVRIESCVFTVVTKRGANRLVFEFCYI